MMELAKLRNFAPNSLKAKEGTLLAITAQEGTLAIPPFETLVKTFTFHAPPNPTWFPVTRTRHAQPKVTSASLIRTLIAMEQSRLRVIVITALQLPYVAQKFRIHRSITS